MTWRCTRCHRTRTDVPVVGVCPCGGHGYSQVADEVREHIERGDIRRMTFGFPPEKKDKD